MAVQKISKVPVDEGRGYSLWFMPSDKLVHSKLSSMIRTISVIYPDIVSKKRPPIFEPHITLVGSITESLPKMFRKTKEIAAGIKPFDINFGLLRSTGNDDYFKAVYLDVNETPGIIDASSVARKILGIRMDTDYNPHLSFVYGNFPHETKLEIVKSVFRMQNGVMSFSDCDFHVDRVALCSTNGPVRLWHKIEEFQLTG